MKKKTINSFMTETGLINAAVIRKELPAGTNAEINIGISNSGVMFLYHLQSATSVAIFISQLKNNLVFVGENSSMLSNHVKDNRICIYRKENGGNIFVKNNTIYLSTKIKIVFLPLSD